MHIKTGKEDMMRGMMRSRKKLDGMLTSELAILLPVILFTFLGLIKSGYDLHEEVKIVSESAWREEFCAEEKVRALKMTSGKAQSGYGG